MIKEGDGTNKLIEQGSIPKSNILRFDMDIR